jgi:hypothetical protein
MDNNAFEYARGRVSGPATALIVVSAISGGILLLSLALDAWLLLSGVAGRLPQPQGMTKDTQIAIRAGWGCLMLATNAVILVGALGMKRLRGSNLSHVACILALIPCLGPCFVLGIPLGIWGLAVLYDPGVRGAFES